MRIASFDETLQTLAGLDGWLTALGIPLKRDRWHEAAATVERAKEQREKIECGIRRSPVANYVPGLFDAMEIYEIIRAFSADRSPALKTKVARAVSGPIFPLEEQPKNSVARNAMFELALAADWKNGGGEVELGEPDILLRVDATSFQVECKRPFHEHSVRANIQHAARQLGKELDRSGNANDFGVVAISLSRAFLHGQVCLAPDGEGSRVLTEALDEIIEDHSNEWRVKGFLNFHERIVAVMFHLAAPWDVNRERLIHLSTSNFVQAGKSAEGFRLLERSISKILPAKSDSG